MNKFISIFLIVIAFYYLQSDTPEQSQPIKNSNLSREKTSEPSFESLQTESKVEDEIIKISSKAGIGANMSAFRNDYNVFKELSSCGSYNSGTILATFFQGHADNISVESNDGSRNPLVKHMLPADVVFDSGTKDLSDPSVDQIVFRGRSELLRETFPYSEGQIFLIDGYIKGTSIIEATVIDCNPEDIPFQAQSNAPVEKTVEKPVDKNPGQTPNQRAAIQTLLDFHSGITNKNLRDAYNCLSMDFQNYMSYDGWTPGFATTVSSEVNDIKVVSESTNEIILSYVLKATDNIQGNRQVSYFNGTVNIINENGRWKIDDIKNKVR